MVSAEALPICGSDFQLDVGHSRTYPVAPNFHGLDIFERNRSRGPHVKDDLAPASREYFEWRTPRGRFPEVLYRYTSQSGPDRWRSSRRLGFASQASE